MNVGDLNRLTKKVIGVAIKIHKKLGPGFPEKIYQRVLNIELNNSQIKSEIEKKITVKWNEEIIGYQFVDLLAENELIIEIKIANEINELYKAQLFSYLKAMDKKLGLILNFGKSVLEIKRVVNNL
jgi:GxxExxY protein